jgi:hypothetical protein
MEELNGKKCSKHQDCMLDTAILPGIDRQSDATFDQDRSRDLNISV